MKRLSTLLAILFWSINSMAQPGALDFTFDPGAGVTGNYKYVSTISVQNDGKVIIGGNFTSFDGTIANRIARLNQNGSLDNTFNTGSGASSGVKTTALQPDGKVIIGGSFTTYNGTTAARVARLNSDGSLDNSFNTGTGADSAILETISLQPNGKIIIGGSFTAFNLVNVGRIARLNTNGSLDTSFHTEVGAGGTIYASAIQDDGKIIIGGTFTTYNGININRIARLNNDGSLDGGFNIGAGFNYSVQSISIQGDGKILIGGSFTTFNGIPVSTIIRLNSDGTMDNSFKAGLITGIGAITGIVNSTSIQSNGKIVIGGTFSFYDGVKVNKIARLNADGSLDYSFSSEIGAGNTIYATGIQEDGKVIIGGAFISYDGTPRNRIARLKGDNGILSSVFLDLDQDCIRDSIETGLANRRLIISPGNILVQTNNHGFWYLDSLPPGNYSITADITGKWQKTCPITQNFSVVNSDSTTLAPDFGFISTEPCPEPEVFIQMPRMRPCFSEQKVYLRASNKSIATDSLKNAFVTVKLDTLLIPQSASLSYTLIDNNTYRFDIGNLAPGQTVNFFMTCSLSCNAVLSQTLCLEANIFPADSCVFDTTSEIPQGTSPCLLPFDKSNIKVSGQCVNDMIRFAVYNIGSPANGNMNCYSPVRLYIDGQFILLDSVKLNGGDSAIYIFAGDGRTWRMEVDQHPKRPGNSHPNATVELCGNPANWTPELVNALPQDDADPVVDIYCGIVTGSYDPNDKRGFPAGVTSENFIYPNQQIEYMIRFQNTGTDTAFTVVIRDTLESDLDIFSVSSGASSHNYTFRMFGPRILEWTFNNILLPDSNTSEPLSHGFVVFNVNQQKDLSNGTILNNTAHIYFDFNEAVVTNTAMHTVNDMLKIPVLAGFTTVNANACGSYILNDLTYAASGTYYQNIKTSQGKDSLITLNLVITDNINTEVTQSSATLTANNANAGYQWIDCDNANTPVNNETNQSFTASSIGNYAVIISENGCVDTSFCYNISSVGIQYNDFGTSLKVFPNPTSNFLNIVTGEDPEPATIHIFDLAGSQIKEQVTWENKTTIKLDGLPQGVYMVKILRGEKKAMVRILVR